MREAAAEERFEDAARYRNRLRADRAAVRAAGGRAAVDRHDRRDRHRGRPERAAVQVFPLREGRMVDRYSFHLENAAGEERRRGARAVLPRVLRLGAVDPAADPRPARLRRRPAARGVPVRAARLARRGARAGARREAAPAGARAAERRSSRSSRRRSSPRRSARAASRRSRSCARRSTSSRCRSGSSASTSRTSRARRSSGSMVVFEDGVAKKAHYRKFTVREHRRAGRLRRDGAR